MPHATVTLHIIAMQTCTNIYSSLLGLLGFEEEFVVDDDSIGIVCNFISNYVKYHANSSGT